MRFYLLPIAAAVFFSQQLPAANEKKVSERLDESAIVLSEIMNANDKGIPEDLLEKAHCAVIVPGMKKGAFIVGGSYGKGFLTCRKTGGWSAPAGCAAAWPASGGSSRRLHRERGCPPRPPRSAPCERRPRR